VVVTFPVLAIDPDGDAVTLSLVNPPQGASLVGGNFSWTPAWTQVGAAIITVRAADQGNLSDSRSCTITVRNQAPVLGPLDDRPAQVGTQLTFLATASDMDGDALTFSLLNPPAGATITPGGTFTWTRSRARKARKPSPSRWPTPATCPMSAPAPSRSPHDDNDFVSAPGKRLGPGLSEPERQRRAPRLPFAGAQARISQPYFSRMTGHQVQPFNRLARIGELSMRRLLFCLTLVGTCIVV